MAAVEELITDHIDIWTSAIKRKSSAGRGGGKKTELYGVKKLRELILDLAMRGLLVPQDPSDEPAPVLLGRIAAEKAELVKAKKIKKQSALPEIDRKALKSLPMGWDYARFGDLTSKLGSGSTPRGGKSAYVESGIPFLRSQNVWNDGLDLSDAAYIPPETHESMNNTKVFTGDVLLNITGASLGRSTIYECEYPEANVSQHVTIVRLLDREMKFFVHLGILSPLIQRLVWERQVGMAIEGLSKKVLELFEFPIPPLEEQHRIVAKVDELMLLCDELEHQTETSIAAHQTLVETLLKALTENATLSTALTKNQNNDSVARHSQFEQAWLRISEHFDTLFTTEHSIELLKQTILKLAFMGKLVPQEPNDEPASELLKRIATEKAELVKAKKIKNQKAFPDINDEETAFELPIGWEWARVGNIYHFLNGFAFKSEWFIESGIRLLRNINIGHGTISWDNRVAIPLEMADEFERFQLSAGDIVITLDRPLINTGLKYAIVSEEDIPSLLLQRIAKFHSIGDFINTAYLALWLESSMFMKSIDPGRSNGVPHISTRQLEVGLFPICSPNEQLRIVAKVEELITLCDQVIYNLSDTHTTQLQLTDAVTEQAID